MNETESKYADKISKLLRKAESTTPEEAEALVEKAQALMTEYAISEELLQKARGINSKETEKIIEHHITYRGSYAAALFDIGSAIARHNSCRTIISKTSKSQILHVIGHESDVELVKMLDSSVQIQAAAAQMRWWKTNRSDYSWMTPMQQYKERREFLFGFARGLNLKLTAAVEKGKREAAAAETKRTQGATSEKHAQEAVGLVVRDKKARVEDWVDQTYGNSLRRVSRRYSSGSGSAGGAGSEAGRKADVSGGGAAGARLKQRARIGA